MASQIARTHLDFPAVIITTSRPKTTAFSKSMGRHPHRQSSRPAPVADCRSQPLRPAQVHLNHAIAGAAPRTVRRDRRPFAKVCIIVQAKNIQMYRTAFMAKSLCYVWELLGTKPYYGVDVESHVRILRELARLVDKGEIKCPLQKRLRLNLEGLRKEHEIIEGGQSMRKVGLGVDVDGGDGGREVFC